MTTLVMDGPTCFMLCVFVLLVSSTTSLSSDCNAFKNISEVDDVTVFKDKTIVENDRISKYQLQNVNITVGFWDYVNSPSLNEMWFDMGLSFLEEMARYLNFTYHLVKIEANENGINVVHQGNVDLLINLLAITPKRIKIVTFLEPIFESYKTCVIRTPPYVSKVNLLAPFDTKTWLFLAFACLASAIIMACDMQVCLPCILWGNSSVNLKKTPLVKKLIYYVQYMVGSLLRQAGTYLPDTVPSRIMLSCWWIFAITVTGLYSADLVSILTIATAVQPFNSITKLVNHPTLKPVVVAGQSIIDDLSASEPDSEFGKLWAKIISDKNLIINSMPQGIHMTLSGNYTMIGNALEMKLVMVQQSDEVFGYDEDGNQQCHLTLSPLSFLTTKMSWMVPKSSPYVDAFNHALHVFMATGLRDKWLADYFPADLEYCINTPSQVIQMKQLTLAKLKSIFHFLFYGGAACLLLLVVEALLYYCWRCQNKNVFKHSTFHT